MSPTLSDQFKAYEKRLKTTMQFLRSVGQFPLSQGRTQSAHEDLSKYFVERAIQLVRKSGRIGLLLPSVFYNGDGCSTLRKWLTQESEIVSVFGFENRQKIFPIDSRYKFACFVCRNEKPIKQEFPAVFMRYNVAELLDEESPWKVMNTADEIEQLSPESYAFLEYRGPRDQEIMRKMYRNCMTLATDGAGSWGARFISWRAHEMVFNSADDKDLWTDISTNKFFTPENVLGPAIENPMELLNAMNRAGFNPVYEGKHIGQFTFGTKPIRWWLKRDQARAKYGREPYIVAFLAFRQTARNTDQRTCIATILPQGSSVSDKLSGLILDKVDPAAALVVMNSFCFDFALRLRTAGTNVSFTYMRPMPVPPASVTNSLPRIPVICAWEHGIEHITELKDHWELLWTANKAVAKVYGLSSDDFAHILGSFPVFAKKHAEFFAFLTSKISSESW